MVEEGSRVEGEGLEGMEVEGGHCDVLGLRSVEEEEEDVRKVLIPWLVV